MNASHTRVPYTAIVPAAGLGTRFLPATKTVPKELLPVAAEAAEAGAERLVIVTSPGKDGVVAHFVEDLYTAVSGTTSETPAAISRPVLTSHWIARITGRS